ncbi:hypothetical protein BB558_004972 [Smittium angustum]|uniref:GATA-type domain-containing protein n=1 Tax=Smittium angustum TaxID=133377 RepID=A0A2U1J1S8_SMIAN|nr:hypothetical protein BB558_006781 [Smittium angustum]PVZ99020.1 hypothetical protein BB558_004972 [Smittium angustum]
MTTSFISENKTKRKGVPVRSPSRSSLTANPGVIFSFPSLISAIRDTYPKVYNFDKIKPEIFNISSYSDKNKRHHANLLSSEDTLFNSYYTNNTYFPLPKKIKKNKISNSNLFDNNELTNSIKRKENSIKAQFPDNPHNTQIELDEKLPLSHKRTGSESGVMDYIESEKRLRKPRTSTEYNHKSASSPIRIDSTLLNTDSATSIPDIIHPILLENNTSKNENYLPSIGRFRFKSQVISPSTRYSYNSDSEKLPTYPNSPLTVSENIPKPSTILNNRPDNVEYYHNNSSEHLSPRQPLFQALGFLSNATPPVKIIIGGTKGHSNTEFAKEKKKKLPKEKKAPKKLATALRVCASCKVNNTPCWRPGWDNLMSLCNSCGLRYKKGGIYCKTCSYVPMKTEIISSTSITCKNCRSDINIHNRI